MNEVHSLRPMNAVVDLLVLRQMPPRAENTRRNQIEVLRKRVGL